MTTSIKSAIFIDLASLQAFTAVRGTPIDLSRLRERLTGDSALLRAAAYGIDHDGQPVPFVDTASMSGKGYKVVTKKLRRRDDGTLHASVHVDLTADALDLAPHIDRLTLVTTDPDFVPLIEALQRRGVRVQVVANGHDRDQALCAAADEALALDHLLSDVARSEGPRRDRRRPMSPRAAPRETARAPVPERPDERPSHQPRAPRVPVPERPDERPSHQPRAPRVPVPERPDERPSHQPQAPKERPRQNHLSTLPEERLSGRAARRAGDDS